jgi:hypothetical protein
MRWGQVAVDQINGNHLRADGMTTLSYNVNGILNDGNVAAAMNGNMASIQATTEVWSVPDFTIGIIFDNGRTSTAGVTYTLNGVDSRAAAFVNKAELRIDASEISGVLYNDAGLPYATVSFDSSWVPGPGRYFAVLQYDSGNNQLVLWVNGYDTSVDTTTGNGAIVQPFPLANDAPTMNLNSHGAVLHSMFYCANFLPREQMTALFATSGMDDGLFRQRYDVLPVTTLKGVVYVAGGQITSPTAFIDFALPDVYGVGAYHLELINIEFSSTDIWSAAFSFDGGATFINDTEHWDSYAGVYMQRDYVSPSPSVTWNTTYDGVIAMGTGSKSRSSLYVNMNAGTALDSPRLFYRVLPTLGEDGAGPPYYVEGEAYLKLDATTPPTLARATHMRIAPYGNGDLNSPTSSTVMTSGTYVLTVSIG